MSTTSSQDPIPSDGERNALVGYSAQFMLAAKVVHRYVPTLQWIRVADPSAGVADDFQFAAAGRRHALQVKWSQFPNTFNFSDLFGSVKGKPSLFAGLAQAWKRIRNDWDGPLTVHLCTNNFPSTTPARAGTALATATDSSPHFRGVLGAVVHACATPPPAQPEGRLGCRSLASISSRPGRMCGRRSKTPAGLTEDEFTDFLRDFDLAFISPDHSDLLSPRAVIDQKHLAATLQERRRRPREHCSSSTDPSSWPDSTGPHEPAIRTRTASRSQTPTPPTALHAQPLKTQLAHHENGYLALIGPPGSGKSTLVEKVLCSGSHRQVLRIRARCTRPAEQSRRSCKVFCMICPWRSKGSGVYREGFGADLAGQRTVLFDQLARAGDAYAKDGTRTTIVVDGLDHIPREQNPTRSLLNELPAPCRATARRLYRPGLTNHVDSSGTNPRSPWMTTPTARASLRSHPSQAKRSNRSRRWLE